ncbi:hypothetical protein [Asanoa iriomotensis]|uniref:hypothetical protein n=1 Tax=Asanoa iriomotensis TaxID=234613 RepID=UPI0023B229C5|nr:hypothetical protein [Asanoa iriomotensis]
MYAQLGVTDFWRVRRHRPDAGELAHVEFAHWRDQEIKATALARTNGPLTEMGRRFLALLDAELQQWAAESVPTGPLDRANAATADRLVSWRLLRRPEMADIDRLAQAWRAHGEVPAPSGTVRLTFDKSAAPHRTNPRIALLYVLLEDPARMEHLQANPAELGSVDANASAADVAFVMGRFEEAVTGYLRQISEDGGDDFTWSGLALAYERQAPASPASLMLLAHPEVVRAVHQRVARQHGDRIDPIALSGWLQHVTTVGD